MNSNAKVKRETATGILLKADPSVPALIVTGRDAIAIRAGTTFAGRAFTEDTPVPMPAGGLTPGTDYVVGVSADEIETVRLVTIPVSVNDTLLGGFHFAPGGNALGRSGADIVPAINPCSLWDLNFRPACPDPRGMALVDAGGPKFWCDIYLLAKDHLEGGSSRFGVTIADGNDPPQNPGGGSFDKLDYATAVAVMKHHGKALLSIHDFFGAAYGVTEKTACRNDPNITGLDAPRTSKWGLMQATGNMWVWGHDGRPDMPRASIFGGSWLGGDNAGSRYADVGHWPGGSDGSIGARGRGDHLQLV